TPTEPPPACTPTYNAAASTSPSHSPLRDYNSSLGETFSGGKISSSAEPLKDGRIEDWTGSPRKMESTIVIR
ncbi:MAG: hypothetical protein ABI147_11615, partial [Acidobacteriaceae bacterium]